MRDSVDESVQWCRCVFALYSHCGTSRSFFESSCECTCAVMHSGDQVLLVLCGHNAYVGGRKITFRRRWWNTSTHIDCWSLGKKIKTSSNYLPLKQIVHLGVVSVVVVGKMRVWQHAFVLNTIFHIFYELFMSVYVLYNVFILVHSKTQFINLYIAVSCALHSLLQRL